MHTAGETSHSEENNTLYDSNYITPGNGKIMETVKRPAVVRGWGLWGRRNEQVEHWEILGQRTTFYGTIMVDICYYTSIKTYRTVHTTNETSCKL